MPLKRSHDEIQRAGGGGFVVRVPKTDSVEVHRMRLHVQEAKRDDDAAMKDEVRSRGVTWGVLRVYTRVLQVVARVPTAPSPLLCHKGGSCCRVASLRADRADPSPAVCVRRRPSHPIDSGP
jgi:hypothetical protein